MQNEASKILLMKSCFLYCSLLCALVLQSCYDEERFTNSSDAVLSFSADTLKFDTVFTSIGSATRHFTIYNNNKDAVRTSVSVPNRYFRLNIDGIATNSYKDLEIRGKDSAYIFVEVTVDPLSDNAPVLILDSVSFTTNGNKQNVKLEAFGQDVVFYNDSIIGNEHWTTDKPYLIYNSILVDTLCTLDIDAGAKIYFHSNSSLLVKGQLHVNGTAEAPVIFQGDRLEEYYAKRPGQWGAAYYVGDIMYYFGNVHILTGSSGNTIDYAIIRNGTKGVQIDNHNEGEVSLKISNTIIENMAISGIYAQNANLQVYNTVVSNCGYYLAALLLGGNYEFVHTTLANYGSHTSQSVVFNNYYVSEDTVNIYDFNALFANSIISGSLTDEFYVNQLDSKGTIFKYKFDNCMLKVGSRFNVSDTSVYRNVITDPTALPRFVNAAEGDYRLDTLSAAKDCGNPAYLIDFPLDLDGNERDSLPDLGAYERIEQ